MTEAGITTNKSCTILLFCELVPCLDQYTDLTMVLRLFRGPNIQSIYCRLGLMYNIHGLELNFPFDQKFRGYFSEQTEEIKTIHRNVSLRLF